MDLSTRIFRLLRSVTDEQIDTIGRVFHQGRGFMDETLSEWEKRAGIYEEEDRFGSSSDWNRKNSGSYDYQRQSSGFEQGAGSSGSFQQEEKSGSQQVVDDLSLFDLKPPSSLDEVKKARNRELKKFHPDKFATDPEKLETAKEIVQIYNEVFERLKKHYQK